MLGFADTLARNLPWTVDVYLFRIVHMEYTEPTALQLNNFPAYNPNALRKLATAAVISYHLHGRTMEGFWFRDKVKDHGTKKLVEGGLKERARVVIVEDVATRGSSALKAIEGVHALGCGNAGVRNLFFAKRFLTPSFP